MFNIIRRGVRRLSGRDALQGRARDSLVELKLPSPYGGKPWMTATVALSSTPHGHGETMRLRAHFDGCMRLPEGHGSRERLGYRHDGPRGLVRAGRDGAAALVRGVVNRLPAERLAPLSARRWRTWLDVQWSTSPLDAGAEALMPERLRGIYGGSLPAGGAGEPRLGVWSGPAGGPAGGTASLALLQLDERDLGIDRHESGSGFNLNASIAQVVEPSAYSDPDD